MKRRVDQQRTNQENEQAPMTRQEESDLVFGRFAVDQAQHRQGSDELKERNRGKRACHDQDDLNMSADHKTMPLQPAVILSTKPGRDRARAVCRRETEVAERQPASRAIIRYQGVTREPCFLWERSFNEGSTAARPAGLSPADVSSRLQVVWLKPSVRRRGSDIVLWGRRRGARPMLVTPSPASKALARAAFRRTSERGYPAGLCAKRTGCIGRIRVGGNSFCKAASPSPFGTKETVKAVWRVSLSLRVVREFTRLSVNGRGPRFGGALKSNATSSPHYGGDGYVFLDGGIWANNPIMAAVIDALSAYDVSRDQIEVLSIGTGNASHDIGAFALHGGLFEWREIITGAMFLTTDNAQAQATLLLGPEKILRLEPLGAATKIELDDYRAAKELLPPLATADFTANRARIADFFRSKVQPRHRFYTST